MKTQFDTHLGLAELPWFRVNDAGRISLAEDLGCAPIDMHTHLALSYGKVAVTDLHAEHDCTEHYLSTDKPLDLRIYSNRNFDPTAVERLTHDLTFRSLTSGGMRATHTAPNLRRELKELGYRHAVLLPIELPVLSDNAGQYAAVARRVPELLTFGSVHPLWRRPGELLERQKRDGARGVKLHPAVQMFRPEGARAHKLYRICGDLNLPILIHAGPVGIETRIGRRLTQMPRYEDAVRRNPQTTFILGHAGARQPEVALQLAQRYPNVWLELSCQGLDSVRTLLKEGPADRMVLGSDWPFYHLAVPLAKVLIATEHDLGLRRAVLHDNAARLLNL